MDQYIVNEEFGNLKQLADLFPHANLPRFFTGFFPTREILVHQGMKTGIVTGFQQVAQFMNHHMSHTPLWQQQQIG